MPNAERILAVAGICCEPDEQGDNRMIKGVIFDFNGVLWWDGHLQDQAWKAYSATLRGYPLTDEEMDVHVHGRNNRYTLRYLLREEIAGAKLERLSEEKETIYRELCLAQGENFRLSPGASEFLDFLADGQIPCTIASASPISNVDFFVQHLELQRWFDPAKIICDDGLRAGKPAPDFFLQAAIELGEEAGDCMIVEDSRSGIKAALAAGAGQIVALGPVQKHASLQALTGVDLTVARLSDIPRMLFLELKSDTAGQGEN